MEANNKETIECYLHIPPLPNNDSQYFNPVPPIQYMEIKDKNINDNILLYIPYTTSLKSKAISFNDAVNKSKITLPNSKDELFLEILQKCYEKSHLFFNKDIIFKNNIKDITLNIDLEHNYNNFEELYFVCNFLVYINPFTECTTNKIIATIPKSHLQPNSNNQDYYHK